MLISVIMMQSDSSHRNLNNFLYAPIPSFVKPVLWMHTAVTVITHAKSEHQDWPSKKYVNSEFWFFGVKGMLSLGEGCTFYIKKDKEIKTDCLWYNVGKILEQSIVA